MTTGSDPVGQFKAGLETLRRYPVLVVPEVAVQAILFVLALIFFGGAVTMFALGGVAGGVASAVGGFLLLVVIGGIVSLVASGVVIVMARDALAGRDPDIGAAVSAVTARFVDVLFASVIAMIMVGVGLVLFVIPGLMAAFFLIFTLPAVLLDGNGAVDALRRSFSVVRQNVGPVIGLIIGWIIVGVVTVIVAKVLGLVPILGALASAVLFGAVIAYLTVVVVSVYQSLPRRPG